MRTYTKYVVGSYDCAGTFAEVGCDSFDAAMVWVRTFREQHPEKPVRVFNRDRCDYDSNGLTEEEEDAIDSMDDRMWP